MASKRRKRRKSCTGKIRFGSEAEARKSAITLSQTVGTMRVYHCPFCGYWHIGHMRVGRKAKRTSHKRGMGFSWL